VRRWVAHPCAEGDGACWQRYEGAIDGRAHVASVVKIVTRWRGYVHAQYSPDGRRTVVSPQRSPIQDSAQAAARWVVGQLDEQARKGAA
jgi:hypothetical protein